MWDRERSESGREMQQESLYIRRLHAKNLLFLALAMRHTVSTCSLPSNCLFRPNSAKGDERWALEEDHGQQSPTFCSQLSGGTPHQNAAHHCWFSAIRDPQLAQCQRLLQAVSSRLLVDIFTIGPSEWKRSVTALYWSGACKDDWNYMRVAAKFSWVECFLRRKIFS